MIELFAAGSSFLLLDQCTKRLAYTRAASCRLARGRGPRLRCVIHSKEVYRRGSARAALVITWFAALATSIFLCRSGAWLPTPITLFGLGAALGGAAGNLLDILRWRGVVDFIDLGWWPVFNLADAGIVVGLAIAFRGAI